MSAEGWVAIGAIAVGLLAQIGISIMAYGALVQKVNNNTEAIKQLWSNKATKEEGENFQAQLNRLERNDAECDGKLGAQRDELNARVDRAVSKIEQMETNRNAESSAIIGTMAEMKAHMLALKEGMARMEAEQLRLATASSPGAQQTREMDILDTLRKAEEFKRMFAGLAKN